MLWHGNRIVAGAGIACTGSVTLGHPQRFPDKPLFCRAGGRSYPVRWRRHQMKQHKLFRTALLERREQYPEMTDGDVVTALRKLVREIAEAAQRRAYEQRMAEIDEILVRPRQPTQPVSDAEKAEMLRRQAEAAAETRRRYEQRIADAREDQKARQEIVKTGHKVLAKKYHPDLGGSAQKMVRLNRARDRLLSE
jgi:hypothetical protein